MYGQRIGALPPYNELLGGKMVALSLTSNEIRESYVKKYKNNKTLLRNRVLPARFLFTTTTSAFGKSSVYERLKYNGNPVAEFIGYTSGSGTFHIPQSLYEDLLELLKQEGINATRGYGTGPSRKLKLIQKALRLLNISTYVFHNIKRGYYLFPNVANLSKVIHENMKPAWFNRPFQELQEHWKKRWCIPRSHRTKVWKQFESSEFFQARKLEIEQLN